MDPLLLLPFVLSFIIGFLFIHLLNPQKPLDLPRHVFLAGGLGLGVSSYIVFYTLLFLDQLSKPAMIGAHLILICILGYKTYLNPYPLKEKLKGLHLKNSWPIIFLIFVLGLMWAYEQLYPWGGWDAWSAWNLKAKFIYLGEDKWKNIFDPVLWRSSPHYPLLLPLITVWGWAFAATPSQKVPFFVSLLFSFLTYGFLFAGLRKKTGDLTALLGALLVSTLPFFIKLSTSQYCDIVFAYYIFAGLYCLVLALQEKEDTFGFLAGSLIGFLSFSKSEGTVAALLVTLLTGPYLLWSKKQDKSLLKKKFISYLLGFTATFLPTILFQVFYSPGNQTFINGFFSIENPSTIARLKMILAFLIVELQSGKWQGIWLLFFIGLILSKGKCFERSIRLIPLFLFGYLFIICFYYYLNTYFKIAWWLQVSLHRILFSLLPVMAFWVFYSLKDKKE